MLVECLPNLALLGIALVCALHFSRDDGQREAVLSLGLVAFNWLQYIMSWTPYSIHFTLKAVGVNIPNAQIWMLTDAVTCAALVLIAMDYEWCAVLWSLSALQVFLHGLYILGGTDFDQYSRFLDYAFWGQIMCFVWFGGPHVVDRLYSAGGRIWDAAHSRASKGAKA